MNITVWMHLKVPKYVDDVGAHRSRGIAFDHCYRLDEAIEFASQLAAMHPTADISVMEYPITTPIEHEWREEGEDG